LADSLWGVNWPGSEKARYLLIKAARVKILGMHWNATKLTISVVYLKHARTALMGPGVCPRLLAPGHVDINAGTTFW